MSIYSPMLSLESWAEIKPVTLSATEPLWAASIVGQSDSGKIYQTCLAMNAASIVSATTQARRWVMDNAPQFSAAIFVNVVEINLE